MSYILCNKWAVNISRRRIGNIDTRCCIFHLPSIFRIKLHFNYVTLLIVHVHNKHIATYVDIYVPTAVAHFLFMLLEKASFNFVGMTFKNKIKNFHYSLITKYFYIRTRILPALRKQHSQARNSKATRTAKKILEWRIEEYSTIQALPENRYPTVRVDILTSGLLSFNCTTLITVYLPSWHRVKFFVLQYTHLQYEQYLFPCCVIFNERFFFRRIKSSRSAMAINSTHKQSCWHRHTPLIVYLLKVGKTCYKYTDHFPVTDYLLYTFVYIESRNTEIDQCLTKRYWSVCIKHLDKVPYNFVTDQSTCFDCITIFFKLWSNSKC